MRRVYPPEPLTRPMLKYRYVPEGIESAYLRSTDASKRSDVTVDVGKDHRRHSAYDAGRSGYERA